MSNETSESPLVRASASRVAIVSACYAVLQLLSNIASLHVGVVFGMAVDMGTFCYPLSFTLRDAAHEVLGKRAVMRLVLASAALCLFASAYLALCARTPAADGAGAEAFRAVFGPMGRLVLASIVAMVASEWADTQVYAWFAKRAPDRVLVRVAASNAVSIPIDNFVFAITAFGWTRPWIVVAQIFLANLFVKFLVSFVAAPWVARSRNRG